MAPPTNLTALTNVCPVCDTPDNDHLDWCTPQARAKTALTSNQWLDPTPEMLREPRFEAIWQVIKSWDINVPHAYRGYCGATGNHVRAILDALSSASGHETFGVDLNYKLPCEVRLPPGMSIGKGCPLSTLLTALRHREQWSDPQDLVFQDERAMAMRRVLSAMQSSEKSEAPRCLKCDDTGTVFDTEGREYDCYACPKGLPDRIMKEPQ